MDPTLSFLSLIDNDSKWVFSLAALLSLTIFMYVSQSLFFLRVLLSIFFYMLKTDFEGNAKIPNSFLLLYRRHEFPFIFSSLPTMR